MNERNRQNPLECSEGDRRLPYKTDNRLQIPEKEETMENPEQSGSSVADSDHKLTPRGTDEREELD